MSSSLHYTNTNSNANSNSNSNSRQQSTSTSTTSTTTTTNLKSNNLNTNVSNNTSNIRRTQSPAIATRTTSLLGTTRYSPSNQLISTPNVVRRSPSITKTANSFSQQQQSTSYSLLQPSSNTQLRYLTVTNPKLPQSYTTTTTPSSSSSIRNSNINRLEDDFKAIYLSNNKNDNEYEYDNLLNRQPQQRRLSTNKQLESNESNSYFNSTSSYLIRKQQQQQQASLNNDTTKTTTTTNRSLAKQTNDPTYDIITNNQNNTSFNLNANGGNSLNLGLEKKGVVGLKNLGNTVNTRFYFNYSIVPNYYLLFLIPTITLKYF